MKAKFLIQGIDTGYPNGGMSLFKFAIASIGGSIITRMPDAKPSQVEKKLDQFKNVMQAEVEVATNDDEVRQYCNDADVVFVMPVGNKVWPTFEEVLGSVRAKKVVFILGTNETRRCPAFVKSRVWDAYWSERPMIMEYLRGRGIVDTKKPYIVGCNVYELKCPHTVDELVSMKNPNSVISSSRFGSFKGSGHILQIFDKLLSTTPTAEIDAWGWSPNEAGISFLSIIKSKPEMMKLWNSTGKQVARGPYRAETIPSFMSKARVSIDLTCGKGDGSYFGDGGLQYVQAESIDWGAIPFCDSNFYVGDEWSSFMMRQPRAYVDEIAGDISNLLQEWDPQKHAKMIEAGRNYIKENMSRERFNESINKVLTSIL